MGRELGSEPDLDKRVKRRATQKRNCLLAGPASEEASDTDKELPIDPLVEPNCRCEGVPVQGRGRTRQRQGLRLCAVSKAGAIPRWPALDSEPTLREGQHLIFSVNQLILFKAASLSLLQ